MKNANTQDALLTQVEVKLLNKATDAQGRAIKNLRDGLLSTLLIETPISGYRRVRSEAEFMKVYARHTSTLTMRTEIARVNEAAVLINEKAQADAEHLRLKHSERAHFAQLLADEKAANDMPAGAERDERLAKLVAEREEVQAEWDRTDAMVKNKILSIELSAKADLINLQKSAPFRSDEELAKAAYEETGAVAWAFLLDELSPETVKHFSQRAREANSDVDWSAVSHARKFDLVWKEIAQVKQVEDVKWAEGCINDLMQLGGELRGQVPINQLISSAERRYTHALRALDVGPLELHKWRAITKHVPRTADTIPILDSVDKKLLSEVKAEDILLAISKLGRVEGLMVGAPERGSEPKHSAAATGSARAAAAQSPGAAPQRRAPQRAATHHAEQRRCFACNMQGHDARDCPNSQAKAAYDALVRARNSATQPPAKTAPAAIQIGNGADKKGTGRFALGSIALERKKDEERPTTLLRHDSVARSPAHGALKPKVLAFDSTPRYERARASSAAASLNVKKDKFERWAVIDTGATHNLTKVEYLQDVKPHHGLVAFADGSTAVSTAKGILTLNIYDAREPGTSQMAEVEAWALDKLDVTLLSAKQFASSGAAIAIKANDSILDFSAIGGTVLNMRTDCQLRVELMRAGKPARETELEGRRAPTNRSALATRSAPKRRRGPAAAAARRADRATKADDAQLLDHTKQSDYYATSSDDDDEGGWITATSRRARSKTPAGATRRAARTRKLPVVALAKND